MGLLLAGMAVLVEEQMVSGVHLEEVEHPVKAILVVLVEIYLVIMVLVVAVVLALLDQMELQVLAATEVLEQLILLELA
jgi:hypothetical protein